MDKEAVTKVFKRAEGNAFIQGKLPEDIGYGFLMYDTEGLVVVACYVDSTGQPILKVAQDGFDALTASDDELIFNSAQNIFKIAQTGTASIDADFSGGAGGLTETITHGLGYVPAALVYRVEDGSGNYTSLPSPTAFTTSGGNVLFNNWMSFSVNATELKINYRSGSASDWGVINFKYYILQETAN